MITRLAMALLLGAAPALGAESANTPVPPADARVELALELIEASRVTTMFESLKPQMQQMFAAQMQDAIACPAAQPTVQAASERFAQLFTEQFDADKLTVDIAALYADMFDESELREMLAFYESDLGRKMLDRMPELMQKSMLLSQQSMRDFMPKVREVMEEYTDDIQRAVAQCRADAEAADDAPADGADTP